MCVCVCVCVCVWRWRWLPASNLIYSNPINRHLRSRFLSFFFRCVQARSFRILHVHTPRDPSDHAIAPSAYLSPLPPPPPHGPQDREKHTTKKLSLTIDQKNQKIQELTQALKADQVSCRMCAASSPPLAQSPYSGAKSLGARAEREGVCAQVPKLVCALLPPLVVVSGAAVAPGSRTWCIGSCDGTCTHTHTRTHSLAYSLKLTSTHARTILKAAPAPGAGSIHHGTRAGAPSCTDMWSCF